MNDPENNLPESSRPINTQDIATEDLRRHLNLLFAAVLISSFTLTAFLGLQGKRAAAELIALRTHTMEQYKQNQEDLVGIRNIYLKLADFGRTHPDFQARVLSRYQFDTNSLPEPAKKK